jgi:hypothetical protein
VHKCAARAVAREHASFFIYFVHNLAPPAAGDVAARFCMCPAPPRRWLKARPPAVGKRLPNPNPNRNPNPPLDCSHGPRPQPTQVAATAALWLIKSFSEISELVRPIAGETEHHLRFGRKVMVALRVIAGFVVLFAILFALGHGVSN